MWIYCFHFAKNVKTFLAENEHAKGVSLSGILKTAWFSVLATRKEWPVS